MKLTRRNLIVLAAAAPLATPLNGALAQTKTAIGGYDTVSYFTVGKPEKGDPKFSHMWDGRTYLFTSEQHRALFAGNPDKYAPQFAGHCASGLAGGQKAEADPTNWLISDGRLYLFYAGTDGPAQMRKDPTIASRADANWKTMR